MSAAQRGMHAGGQWQLGSASGRGALQACTVSCVACGQPTPSGRYYIKPSFDSGGLLRAVVVRAAVVGYLSVLLVSCTKYMPVGHWLSRRSRSV